MFPELSITPSIYKLTKLPFFWTTIWFHWFGLDWELHSIQVLHVETASLTKYFELPSPGQGGTVDEYPIPYPL